MERDTIEVYERQAGDYLAARPKRDLITAGARALSAAARRIGPVVDLGCGPGIYTPDLGSSPVALDASRAMLDLTRTAAPHALLVQADLERPPFAPRSLGGAFARASYQHVAPERLPLALARLHACLAVGSPVTLVVVAADDGEPDTFVSSDDLPGRTFWRWDPDHFADVVAGAGFTVEGVDRDGPWLWLRGRRERTLADTVAPGMTVLVCGLNPSLHAADAGYGYAGPANRFWPAALAAGLVDVARDPFHALERGVGMTDVVKRATPRAADLARDEFRAGVARVERLVGWLNPAVVCFVGLAGYRAAVDRRATVGWHEFGGVPAYVMPSTSGLNAKTSLAELSEHLREVRRRAKRR